MSQPIIHLEEHYLEKVLIERIASDTVDDQMSIAFGFDYDVQRSEQNPLLFLLTLKVRNNPEAKTPYPQLYKIDLRIRGIFRFDEGIDEPKMKYLVRVNGGTILYGILRGILTSFTGAFPDGRISLPTITMADVVRTVEEKRKVKPVKKSAPAKKAAKATKKTPRKTVKKQD